MTVEVLFGSFVSLCVCVCVVRLHTQRANCTFQIFALQPIYTIIEYRF